MRPEIDLDTSIAKYMSLTHLLYMLENKTFYIRRRYTFDDRKESTIYPWEIGALYGFQSKPSKDVIAKNQQATQKLIDEHKKYCNLPTSCWTLNSDENYLMWKAYAPECGVMITSSGNRLVDAIDYSGYDLICIPLIYKGYRNQNILSAKDRFYSDEREVRFYFDSDNDDTTNSEGDHIELPICPEKLIGKIVISPFIKKTKALEIKKILKDKYQLHAELSSIEVHNEPWKINIEQSNNRVNPDKQ